MAASTVLVNDAPRAATYVSDTALRFDMQAEELSSQATLTVSVNNPAPGGGASNELSFTVLPSLPDDPYDYGY